MTDVEAKEQAATLRALLKDMAASTLRVAMANLPACMVEIHDDHACEDCSVIAYCAEQLVGAVEKAMGAHGAQKEPTE